MSSDSTMIENLILLMRSPVNCLNAVVQELIDAVFAYSSTHSCLCHRDVWQ